MKTREINHLAMVTDDTEKTVRSYRDVMGFPLVVAIGNNPNAARLGIISSKPVPTRLSRSSNGSALGSSTNPRA